MSHLLKFVAALIVLLTMAILASRQLFLFAAFGDSAGSQGDRYHLWLGLSAAIGACIAAAAMFHFFFLYDRNKWSKVARASTGPLIIDVVPGPSLAAVPVTIDSKSWARANAWLADGQADDRTPVNGSVAQSQRPAPAQRAFARSSHQLMFKKWSQGRHD